MQRYELRGDFGLENLERVEAPRPEPGPRDIVVRIRAVSPNYRDLMMIRGAYNPNQSLPLVPFSDAVGDVVEVGGEVSRFEAGDRASPIFVQSWLAGRPNRARVRSALGGPLDGTLSEYMAVPAESAVGPPSHLSDVEAATLPCTGVTAWHALVEEGDVSAGDTVVCLGTGGVSSQAQLIAQMLGADVIATSSSDDKLQRAVDLEADEGINYERTPEWGEEVRGLTGGVGADHIVEVGGAETLEQSIEAVRIGGRISLIGVLSGVVEDIDIVPVLMQNICIQGIFVGNREMFERLNRALDANGMHPTVDRVFGFDEVERALQFVADGRHIGNVAVELPG